MVATFWYTTGKSTITSNYGVSSPLLALYSGRKEIQKLSYKHWSRGVRRLLLALTGCGLLYCWTESVARLCSHVIDSGLSRSTLTVTREVCSYPPRSKQFLRRSARNSRLRQVWLTLSCIRTSCAPV